MAELTISAADIASALKSNLEGFEPSVEARTVGRVASVGDGIARHDTPHTLQAPGTAFPARRATAAAVTG